MSCNILIKLRELVSYIAVFVTIWALIACAITFLWWIMPFCSENIMFIGRWLVSGVIIIWMITTRRLTIN